MTNHDSPTCGRCRRGIDSRTVRWEDPCGCYRVVPGETLNRKRPREVVRYTALRHGTDRDCVFFRCPCGERSVHVSSPPHEIELDAEGIVSLNGSVGSRAVVFRDGEERPRNWCHFWLKQGEVEMCSDAQCPGGSAS